MYEYDARTYDLVDKLEGLSEDPQYSIDVYFKNVVSCFEEGVAPLTKFYIQGDIGNSVTFVTGLDLYHGWTFTEIVTVFRKHHDSFPQEISNEIEEIGCRSENLMNEVTFSEREERIRSVKLMGLIRRTFEIFPKHPPRFTNYIPTWNFKVSRKAYQINRKLVVKHWQNCVAFVAENTIIEEGSPSNQKPADCGWSSSIPPQICTTFDGANGTIQKPKSNFASHTLQWGWEWDSGFYTPNEGIVEVLINEDDTITQDLQPAEEGNPRRFGWNWTRGLYFENEDCKAIVDLNIPMAQSSFSYQTPTEMTWIWDWKTSSFIPTRDLATLIDENIMNAQASQSYRGPFEYEWIFDTLTDSFIPAKVYEELVVARKSFANVAESNRIVIDNCGWTWDWNSVSNPPPVSGASDPSRNSSGIQSEKGEDEMEWEMENGAQEQQSQSGRSDPNVPSDSQSNGGNLLVLDPNMTEKEHIEYVLNLVWKPQQNEDEGKASPSNSVLQMDQRREGSKEENGEHRPRPFVPVDPNSARCYYVSRCQSIRLQIERMDQIKLKQQRKRRKVISTESPSTQKDNSILQNGTLQHQEFKSFSTIDHDSMDSQNPFL